VRARETLSSLTIDSVTHIWLGSFAGLVETAKGPCRKLEPDGGLTELSIRYVDVELEADVSSSCLCTAWKLVRLWLEETLWHPPLALTFRGQQEASDVGGDDGGRERRSAGTGVGAAG
ncbi:MAG: hypothetical protein SGPRY_011143, partial [Prymnesium sp.]